MAHKKNPKGHKPDPATGPEGYPSYPEDQDIYRQALEKINIDPEDPVIRKETDPDPDNILRGESLVTEGLMGSDLDIPGSELDDDLEEIGSEDEENNYYSLGGEKDLEEQHGDEDFPR